MDERTGWNESRGDGGPRPLGVLEISMISNPEDLTLTGLSARLETRRTEKKTLAAVVEITRRESGTRTNSRIQRAVRGTARPPRSPPRKQKTMETLRTSALPEGFQGASLMSQRTHALEMTMEALPSAESLQPHASLLRQQSV